MHQDPVVICCVIEKAISLCTQCLSGLQDSDSYAHSSNPCPDQVPVFPRNP